MSAIQTHDLTKEEYEDARYQLIKELEEGGHENLDLYIDSHGLVSTGVGFNLTVVPVAEAFLVNALLFRRMKLPR